MSGFRETCKCGRVPTNELGLCATCIDELPIVPCEICGDPVLEGTGYHVSDPIDLAALKADDGDEDLPF